MNKRGILEITYHNGDVDVFNYTNDTSLNLNNIQKEGVMIKEPDSTVFVISGHAVRKTVYYPMSANEYKDID